MKFRKLLAGTALAALMGSNAHALSISLLADASNAPGPDTTTVQAAADVIEAPVFIASETNLADGTQNNGRFVIGVTTNNTIANANNYLITLAVTGGTIDTQADGSDLLNGTGAGPAPAPQAVTFTGTTVQFDGADRTGEVGDSSVRFLASSTSTGNNFGIVVDVNQTCAGPLNFTLTLTTESGTPIEEGTVSLAAPAAQCVDAYQMQVNNDQFELGGGDSELLAATSFATLNAAVPAPGGLPNDTATEATVGVVDYVFNPLGVPAGNLFASLADAEDGATSIVDDPTQISAVRLTVGVDSTVGVRGIGQRAVGGATTPLTAGAATFNVVPAAPTSGIEVQLTGTDSLLPTTPTVTDSRVSFVNAALAPESAVFRFGPVLDILNYEGDTCGTFDWVGDNTTTRRNVFRATNFGDAANQGVFATMTNSSAGLANDTVRLSGLVVSGPEMSFTDEQLTAAFGAYGRADFLFNFITATNVDCDRLMASPVDAIVTSFGNNAVTGGGTDGDDN
jgi:hypothetical protein